MMIQKTVTILFIGLLFQVGIAQTIDKVKLDSYFQELEKSNKFMGSVAISQNGKILYTKAIGFSDVETSTKPNENTKYRIGSITKSFTAVLILKAIEENKLTLDTKLDKYYPTIKNADKISISNLLNHRSGIHNFTNDEDYIKWDTQKKSENEMVQVIEKGGSDFEPDSKADYSNSNYILLGYILEKIYKKNYADVLTDKITKPIGLKNTFVGGAINSKNNESYSYTFTSKWDKGTETDMSIPMGAGAIISTPSDLTQFAVALFSYKIISQKSLESMKTMKDNFGYGLFQTPFNDKKGYGHNGGIDNFRSVYGYFPDEKVAVAITSNGGSYAPDNVLKTLLNAAFNIPYEIPVFKTYAVTTADLDKYLGTYSSKEIPLKIVITKKDNILLAQATGQPMLPIEATDKDKFEFAQAGAVFEFIPTDKKMMLKQGGQTFTFTIEL